MAIVFKIFENLSSALWNIGLHNVGIVILCVILLLLVLSVARSRSGPNPFSKECLRSPGELVTDKAKRDAVLKQGFTSKKIPENLDAIIIGSGIGGLTTAALLAKAGKKVLVLEQHDQAGGCCHSYIEKGYEFDVGIHYVGEASSNTMTHVLLNQITEGQLQFAPQEHNFDRVYLGDIKNPKMIKYYSGKEDMKRGLKEAFPEEEKAIEKFFELVKEAKSSILGWIMMKVYPLWISKFLVYTGLVHKVTKFFKIGEKSLTQVLDELTDNEELKATLSYSFGDYGTLPRDVPFSFHALLFQHFMYGTYYPVGGASEIAFNIIPVIEKPGGKVLVRATVTEILMNSSGKAYGVRVTKGGNDYDVHAPLVISAAGVLNTYGKLVPKPLRERTEITSLLSNVKSGYGGMSVFIGLKGSKEELGLAARNHWMFTGSNLNKLFDDFLLLSKDEVGQEDIPLLFVSFPSTKDPEWEKRFPGKSTCAIVTLNNWEWFEEWQNERIMKRGADYEAVKNRIAERAWKQVCTLFPQLEDKREYFEVGTPLTHQYYIASPRGEIYGLDHNIKRFSPEMGLHLRAETPFPGLLLTGQDVQSCGFCGALYAGVITASKALNRNLLYDLRSFTMGIRKEAAAKAKKE